MIKNKKITMVLSFGIGVLLLATTAFADIVSTSGYDFLKSTIKHNAEKFLEKTDSYSTNVNLIVKDNEKTVFSSIVNEKQSIAKKSKETITKNEYSNGEIENTYNYSDTKCEIKFNPKDNIYYLTEFTNEREIMTASTSNPFATEYSEGVEKIVDALVGDLKNYVVSEEKQDGGKVITGSLSQNQMPALINALVSFQFKNMGSTGLFSSDTKVQITNLEKDIYVKKVSGKIETDKENVINSVLVTGILSGKDKNGLEHDITVEALIKFFDFDKTEVIKPNLEGKKIEKTIDTGYGSQAIVPAKYIGKYKNDVILDSGSKVEKIGERVIEITSVTDKTYSGKYYEVYKDVNSENAKNKKEFNFTVNFDNSTPIVINDADGNKSNAWISLDTNTYKINLNFENEAFKSNMNIDSQFSKVFE